jgi:hypothetical protein
LNPIGRYADNDFTVSLLSLVIILLASRNTLFGTAWRGIGKGLAAWN